MLSMSETYQKDSRNLEEIVVDLHVKEGEINAGVEGARGALIKAEEKYNTIVELVKLYAREKISVDLERKREATIAGVEGAREALLQAEEHYNTIVELYTSK